MIPNAKKQDPAFPHFVRESRTTYSAPHSRGGRAWPALTLGAALTASAAGPASAHDVWTNGQVVPAWVKKACCGPEDVHHLTPQQVHLTPAGWKVDGYPDLIPLGKELPSPDGEYWVFYRTLDNGDKTIVYCFFTPFNGN